MLTSISSETPQSPLPRLTWRSKRAWRLLANCKPFYLSRGLETYYVDRGGWATLLDSTQQTAVRASKLLDPEKQPEPQRSRRG